MNVPQAPVSPKIELHVHLEGTIRARTLLVIARRNGLPLPAGTVEGLAAIYEFRDFTHFLDVWRLTTNCLRTAEDFRQVVVDYAAEAAAYGAVYIEGIISPAERVIQTGLSWDALFNGYCDGAQQAREDYGVIVGLTPDLFWGMDPADAVDAARKAVEYRDRGVVGLGIGGEEGSCPPEAYAKAFAVARDGGLGSVPHAGEGAGPDSVRAVLDSLGADRIRHGVRAAEDPSLVRELADRGVVLDVCPTSNLRTRVVASLADHPLPALLRAGVGCSVSTDDPAMFGTDLGQEYELLPRMGVDARQVYQAASRGALCDEGTRRMIIAIGEQAVWPGP